jgi:Na+/H+-dicarboxylate symporter
MKIGFGNQCLLALILGLAIGHFLPNDIIDFIQPFGLAFLKLLKLVTIPLVFTTIVSSFAKLKHITEIKKMGLATLVWFMLTAIVASCIGLAIGSYLHIGNNLQLDATLVAQYTPRVIPNLSATFLDMVPGDLIQEIANGKIIPVIIFAIIFGIMLTTLQEKVATVNNFFNEFAQIMFKITRFVIRLSPIGIFALVVVVSHDYGISTLIPLAKFIVAIYLACFLQLLFYALLLFSVAHKNPWQFVKEFYPAMITAFTTSSSLGSLPVVLERLADNVKVRANVIGFVAPLGATMKMDGCGAIYPAIVCILTANLLHIDLSTQQYILIIVVATIASIGTAGVPGTASIMGTVVLTSVGLPLQGLALVIGIDKIVDMMRTLTNVTGSGVCTVLVNKFYK